MANPQIEDLSKKTKTEGNNGQRSDNNGQTSTGDNEGKGQPEVANKNKLLKPLWTAAEGKQSKAITEGQAPKVPGEVPDVRIVDTNHSPKKTPPQDKFDYPIDFLNQANVLAREDWVQTVAKHMGLNQAIYTLRLCMSDLQTAYGYNPRERVLGYGTERYNRDNPLVDPRTSYRPDQHNIDPLKLRQALEQSRSMQQPILPELSLEKLAKQDELDPFKLRGLPNLDESQLQQKLKDDIAAFNLATATFEEKRQFDQFKDIRHALLQDPDMRQRSTLRALRVREGQLTPERQEVYARQEELQAKLRTVDVLCHRIDELRAGIRTSNVSEDFVKRGTAVYNRIPEHLREDVKQVGFMVVLAHHLTQENIMPQLAARKKIPPANTDLLKRIAVVAEFREIDNKLVANKDEQGLLYHEFGHALDAAWGKDGVGVRFSHSEAFFRAYKQDVMQQGSIYLLPQSGDRERLKYMLQDRGVGEEEAFAEAVAASLGGYTRQSENVLFPKVFPGVLKLVKAEIEARKKLFEERNKQ